MAEETDTPEAGDAGGGKNKLILFIALPVVILLLAGAAAFLLLGGGEGEDHDEHAEAHGEAHGDAPHDDHGEGDHDGHGEAGHAPAAEVIFYELPDVLVNIQSDGERQRYLKLSLTLELDGPDVVAMVEPAMPRVMDRFQAFLRELRVEDLAGSAGSHRLRVELLRRANLAAAPAQVRAVLIEEMLVQ